MSANDRVNKLLLWAMISPSHPCSDLAVFGCAFVEWYCARLAHMEQCETCREADGALMRQTLETHHRVVTALLSAKSIDDVKAAMDAQAETAELDRMPILSSTKH